jgi:pilus assembly protein Flp/PilA
MSQQPGAQRRRNATVGGSYNGQLAPEGGERTVQHISTLMALVTRSSRDDEDGQGLAEYALILALIAIVAIVALLFLGSQISDKLSVIGGALQSSAP